MSRTACQRLTDILERIAGATTAESRLTAAETEHDDELVQIAFDAVLYDLLVIGEAIKSLPNEWKDDHPAVPWSDAAGMRDILAHQYFRIRSDVVRSTLDAPLAALRLACEAIIEVRCSPNS
ncbi:DUF86 domain-containing protein [Aquihabitans daechungensis]|uniref:HepT-like ribonuclease domain-containing protein n=1 Tax=Aquihabitans daechungensis TaxID=1052257 RepID=UPI003B9DEDB6